MCATIILEWTYSPPNLFEEPFTIEQDGYVISIEEGKIEARIPENIFEANASLRGELHESLNSRFLALQLLSHLTYELSESQMTREHADGKRDIIVEVPTMKIAISGGQADFVLRDKDGNIKTDTKRERIEHKKSFSQKISDVTKTDDLLLSMLRSYSASVNDPGNELIHLYEIREALAKYFSGEKEARQALNISNTKWSKFGQLCNNAPLRQGRHRGQNIGGLREATKEELNEVREIASEMINGYLSFLEESS